MKDVVYNMNSQQIVGVFWCKNNNTRSPNRRYQAMTVVSSRNLPSENWNLKFVQSFEFC